jgi:hypothetical protein
MERGCRWWEMVKVFGGIAGAVGVSSLDEVGCSKV